MKVDIKKMNRVMLFALFNKYTGDNCVANFFTCEGHAVDIMHKINDQVPPEEKFHIRKVWVYCDDPSKVNSLAHPYQALHPVYADCGHWFINRELALEEARELWGDDIEIHSRKGVIDSTRIDPLVYPIELFFRYDDENRLFTRFEPNPEKNGLNGNGKICFIDQSVKNPDFGRMKVDKMIIKRTYAFAVGEMIRYEDPDISWNTALEAVIRSACAKPEGTFCQIYSKSRGTYYAYHDKVMDKFYRVENAPGMTHLYVSRSYDEVIEWDYKHAKVIETGNISEFF